MTAKPYTETCGDPREVPPIGWCAECIRAGDWVRAATLYQGTGLCAGHLLFIAKAIDDDASLDERAAESGQTREALVKEHLRSDLSRQLRTLGF